MAPQKPTYVSQESLVSGGAVPKANPAGMLSPNLWSGAMNALSMNVRPSMLQTPETKAQIDQYPRTFSKQQSDQFVKQVAWSAEKIADDRAKYEAIEKMDSFKQAMHNLKYGVDDQGIPTGILHKTGGDFIKNADQARLEVEQLQQSFLNDIDSSRTRQYFLSESNQEKDATQNTISAKTVKEQDVYAGEMQAMVYKNTAAELLNTPASTQVKGDMIKMGAERIGQWYPEGEARLLAQSKFINEMALQQVEMYLQMDEADGFDPFEEATAFMDQFDDGTFATNPNTGKPVNVLDINTIAKADKAIESALSYESSKDVNQMKADVVAAEREAYNYIALASTGTWPVTRDNLPDHLYTLKEVLGPLEYVTMENILVDYVTGDEFSTDAGVRDLDLAVNTSDTDVDFAEKLTNVKGVTYNQRLQAWTRYRAGRDNGINTMVKQFETYMDSIAVRAPRTSGEMAWAGDEGPTGQDAVYAVEGYQQQKEKAASIVRSYLDKAVKDGASLNEAFRDIATKQLNMTTWSAIQATEAVASQIFTDYSFMADMKTRMKTDDLASAAITVGASLTQDQFLKEFSTFSREAIMNMRKDGLPETVINANILTLDVQYELIKDIAYETGAYRKAAVANSAGGGNDRNIVDQAKNKAD